MSAGRLRTTAGFLADFAEAAPVRSTLTGFIATMIRRAVRDWSADKPTDAITISAAQQNGSFGIYQACVHLAGDPTTYRLLLAPDDAPIAVNGRPISEHFALPLGDHA